MSASPRSPRTLKGGFVLMDGDGRAVLRSVAFQYNPDTLTRTLTPRQAASETGDRLEALRLRGAPVETLRLEIELDATDRLEQPASNPETVANGILPELADLETIIAPAVADLIAADTLADTGTLEILPLPSPLVLVVLGPRRVLPVRVTEFGVVEEAFDTQLNPIRAKITLGLRILSNDDLTYGSKGAALFFAQAQRRESFARRTAPALSTLGLTGAP
ncbi:hypothetical protein [Sphingomonas nostoxanthinifaciens]|uniref:hypothetical protein n=1 Tax=Sphingomonas nostoxanthinifaciens TaxID=2872652 RepID=UPI001CC210A8|nr:hypothetical protein [Sphingomonas nostoxanthinifaciens]UAK23293.1 hypothetical protein K8P63_12875 [Sphingomonas nostoxanthinifaciens]